MLCTAGAVSVDLCGRRDPSKMESCHFKTVNIRKARQVKGNLWLALLSAYALCLTRVSQTAL